MNGVDLVRMFLDPRGRAGRKGFLTASMAILGVEILGSVLIYGGGLSADHAVIAGLKGMLLWMCAVALIKRLHDLGYSAWMLLVAGAAVAAWVALFVTGFIAVAGMAAVEAGSVGFMVLNAGAMAPALAGLLWLQFAAGVPHFNRHGAVPDASGFAYGTATPMPSGLTARTQS